MKRNFRWTAVGGALTAAVLAVSLSACTAPANPTSTTSATATKIKTLQFVNPLPSTSVWEQISTCMAEESKAKGIKYNETGPSASQPADPTVMIQQVQDAVAAGKSAIVTFPASASFGPVLQAAQKAGVVTATLYGDGTVASGATVNAGVDWNVIGKEYVDAIAKRSGNHVVGLVAEAPTGPGQAWVQGVTTAAAKTSNVKIGGTVYIGADASQALPQVTSLLTAHPDIDIVASNTGIMTQGGVAAIKQLNLQNKVHLLVINNANGALQAVDDGQAFGVYLQNLCTLAKQTVDGVVKAAATGKRIPLIEVQDVIATKSNINSYIKKGFN